MKPTETATLVIGASISGLATAACLKQKDQDYIIIEKASTIAAPWRNHYDRLHLHTHKAISGLPFKPFGKHVPRYPGRLDMVNYLEEYQSLFNIQPVFNTAALRVTRDRNKWITETPSQTFASRNLVIATGVFGEPKQIKIAGLETFASKLLHSSDYKTGKDFAGKKVLLIGFGNSACEIAIDLFEQGANPSVSLRSPVNVLPRDIFGIPVLAWAGILNKFPPAVADAISAPLISWKIGNLEKIGLEKKAYGPFTQIHNDRQVPVIDIGTLQMIRDGKIKVFKSINRVEGSNVLFDDGRSGEFDVIIVAAGFVKSIPDIIGLDPARLKDLNQPSYRQEFFGKDGLYFCGFYIGATGQINEIGKDAQLIADRIRYS